MKKRILSLLLCTMLLIPFVLSSCFVPGKGPEDTKKSFFEEMSGMFTSPPVNFNSSKDFVATGTVVNSAGKLAYIRESNVSLDTGITTTTHKVVDVTTGGTIYSYDITYSVGDLSYTSDYTAVSVALSNQGPFVVRKTDKESNITTSVYNSKGTELISGADVTYSFIDAERIIFDNVIYTLGENEATMVKDISDSSIGDILSEMIDIGDKYLYIDDVEMVAYYFDSSYNFLHMQILSLSPGNTYTDEQEQVFYIGNGNLLYQHSSQLCEYSPLVNTNSYDFIRDGYCYKLTTYLFNAQSREYKEIDLPYTLLTAFSPNLLIDEAVTLPYGADALGIGIRIDDKKLVYTSNSKVATFFLFLNGTYKEIPEIDGTTEIAQIGETRYAAKGEFFVNIYNEKDELVGTLDSMKSYNEKYIITNTKIYNHNLELVYSLDDNDANVAFELNDSIIIEKQNKETNAYAYYLITPAQAEPLLVAENKNDVVLREHDNYYYTLANVYDTETGVIISKALTIFKTNGELIGSYALSATASISRSQLDDMDILRATNSEGNTLFISVYYEKPNAQ